MDGVVVSLPLTEVERRTLEMLGTLHPDHDDGLALGLLTSRVQALRDGSGLGRGGRNADLVRGLEIADDVLCLLLASRPAEVENTVIERARLFSRHRGGVGRRVELFTRAALEADRRRLGIRRSVFA